MFDIGAELERKRARLADKPYRASNEIFLALDAEGFKEAEHPRDKGGKFTYGKAGSAVHGVLTEGGFTKGPKSPAGKPVYVHSSGNHKVIIEPPDVPGTNQSSNWTHIHPTGQVSGSGSASLKKQLSQLWPLVPKVTPAAANKIVDVTNHLEQDGFKPVKDGYFTKGESVAKINPDASWILQTPGHASKQGKGLEALAALMSGNDWQSKGVTNYTGGKLEPPTPESEAKQILTKNAPKPTSEEAEAIGTYTGTGYSYMNDTLRHKGKHTAKTKQLQGWLDKASFPADLVVYRKVSSDYAKVLKSMAFPGMVFQDRGFMSTSTKPDVWHGELKMHIQIKRGQKAATVKHISSHKHEEEVLVQCGSKLRIVDFDYDKGFIHAELVQDG